MNYLAHLFLADDDPDCLIGSLMGDFVKGRVDPALAPGLRRGIALHRRVDSFTDAHAIVRASKRRLQPGLRRFGGILVDLYYDHYLAVHWSRYSPLALEDFVAGVHRVLRARMTELPPRMQHSMRYMTATDLLLSYRDIGGIGRALRGIEGRLTRPSRLRDGVEDLQRHYGAFDADFAAFFPQLIDFVARQGSAGKTHGDP